MRRRSAQTIRTHRWAVQDSRRRASRAHRAGDLGEADSWERSAKASEMLIKQVIGFHPELADDELVKRLAPTKVERLAQWIRRK